jgi:hypothetical protein
LKILCPHDRDVDEPPLAVEIVVVRQAINVDLSTIEPSGDSFGACFP